jgi:type II secretory pathway predicted ATPase ExeA
MTGIVNRIVSHPDYKAAFTRISTIHKDYPHCGRPENLRLYGPSGAGKTTLLKYYHSLFPPIIEEDRTRLRVLYVVVPSMPTAKQVVSELLRALGLSQIPKGNLASQIDQFLKLAKEAGVELLLVDEVQHFIDRGTLKTQTAVADILKVVIEQLNISVVFAGAPRMEMLFSINMQLRRRFYSSITLRPFDIEASFDWLRGFTLELAKDFPELDREWLSSSDTSRRIFFATDGMPGNIADLLRTTERLQKNDVRLGLPTMSIAFRSTFFPEATNSSDPFSQFFRFERLTRPGEPFAPSLLDGDNHSGRFLDCGKEVQS